MATPKCGHGPKPYRCSLCYKCYSTLNREKLNKYSRDWRASHKEKVKKWVTEASMKTLYGINQAQYDAMFINQKGVCAICKRPDKRRLSVDHDHETKKVRALLCGKCNRGLGFFEDSHFLLTKASQYLRVREGVI